MSDTIKDQMQIIKGTVEEILSKLTIDAKVEMLETVDGPKFIIRTQEGRLLIGGNGRNLISLNHIVKKIISKKISKEKQSFSFSLDINDYQAKKIEDLKNLARLNAQRVRYFKKEMVLRVMTSFERRIIHITLVDYPDIITESQGSEPQKQVVIKPYP